MTHDKDIRLMLKYDPDTGIFTWIQRPNGRVENGSIAGCKLAKDGYRTIQFNGKMYRSARLAWWFYYGKWPKNVVDHINGDKLDDRICNLRDVSSKANSQNKKCHRAGHLLGTANDHGKWRSQCTENGKKIIIGYYKTAEEAHAAYLEYVGRVKS